MSVAGGIMISQSVHNRVIVITRMVTAIEKIEAVLI